MIALVALASQAAFLERRLQVFDDAQTIDDGNGEVVVD